MKLLKSFDLASSTAKQKGFSLVELMVVVAIIAVLAAIAIPRFRVFQARARQSEAKTNLSHLFTLEQSYHADNDTYVTLPDNECAGANDLGFNIPGGCGLSNTSKTRYKYWVPNADTVSFTAHAKSGEGPANRVNVDCPADEWTIDQNKEIKAVTDSIKTCDK